MEYEITGFDICVQGFERLRSIGEFILPVSVGNDTSKKALLLSLEAELHAIAREDSFDFDNAKNCFSTFVEDNWGSIQKTLLSLDDIDEEADNSDWPGCYAFLYMNPKY